MIDILECVDQYEPVETPLLLPDEYGHLYHPKGFVLPAERLLDYTGREHPLWENLLTKIAQKKATRVIVPDLENAVITPETVEEIPLAYLSSNGGRTVYARNKGKPDIKYLPPSSGGLTKSELAREYLKYVLAEAKATGKVGRCPKSYEAYLKYPASLYYQPGPLNGRHRGQFAYVDISQAYWTIHRTATIDMSFNPGQWALMGRAEYRDVAEVSAYRELRHAIPGSLALGTMQLFRYGQQEETDFKGSFFYPGIVGYTMHVMHSIAREVIDNFGAMMVLTDAYIVPAQYADLVVDFLRERWGVEAIVKAEGDGALYGLNVYQVGNHRTGHAPARWTSASQWKYTSSNGQEIVLKPDSSAISTLLDVDTSWVHRERQSILSAKLGQS